MFKYVFSHILVGDVTGNMTLAIPDEMQKKMKKLSDVRWSNVARASFEKKIQELEMMDEILKNSKFTEKDAEEIGHKIKHEIWKRFGKRFNE